MSENVDKKETLSPAAREAYLAYRRKWYQEHKSKQAEYTLRYWEKKARLAAEAEKEKEEKAAKAAKRKAKREAKKAEEAR